MALISRRGRRVRLRASSSVSALQPSTGSSEPSTRGSSSAPWGRLRSRLGRLRQLGTTNWWMAVLLVVMVGKAGEWVPLVKGLPVLKIAFVVTAIYLSSVSGALAPVRVQSIPLARFAIAFLTLSIVSIVFSIYRTQTLLASYLSVIYLISFVLLLKTTRTRKDVERLLIGLAVAGSSLSIAVVILHHGGRAHIDSAFDANDLAYSLVTLLPIALVLCGSRWGLRRFLVTGLVLLMCGAVLMTASRGGALGLLVVLLAVSAFPLELGKNGELKGFQPARLLVRLGFVAVLGVLFFAFLPETSQERLLTLIHPEEDYNTSTAADGSRLVIWTRDVGLALQRPIGYGMATAATANMIYAHSPHYRTAHNSVVQAFLELGALGLYLYLACYYVAWRDLGRISAAHPRDGPDHEGAKAALYARALRVALLGNFAAGFFLSQAYSASLWMILGVCCAFSQIETSANPAGRRK